MNRLHAVAIAALAGVAGLAIGLAVPRLATDGSSHATHTASPPAAAASGGRQVLYWYDPMVPTQRFDRPGKSPFMDMQLVPRYADEGGGEAAGGVSVSPQAVQSLGVRVAVAEKRRLGSAIEAVGSVGLNERDVAIVQPRANGFVERVYGRAPGDVIAAGAPIADVLHPEWLAAQNEYLAVRATGDATLAAAARQRLVLLGLPAATVEQIEREGRPLATTTIVSPIAGLVAELMVRPGMTVAAGMTLARINGLGTMWVDAAVPEAEAAAVRPGQAAELRFVATPGEAFRGRVAAVLPEANRESRTLRVRIEVPNPGGRLKAGQFAQVSLRGAGTDEAVVVPAEAVIRTGRRALVYRVEGPGRYRPLEVVLGAEADGYVAVRRGLSAGDPVVASGQFLIDSEASLQGLTARGHVPAAAASSATSAAAAPSHRTSGTVVEVERDALTLEHAPVPALKWPAMTMPFKLADPALARGLKAGDAVTFRFVQRGDDNVVTAVERRASASGGAKAGPAGASGGRP